MIPRAELRPITSTDPRWPWEPEPLQEYRSSVHRRRAQIAAPVDRSQFYYDGMPPANFGRPLGVPRLSVVESHIAGGSPWSL